MSAPILITRESLAAGAAERWREQYEDYWTSERPALGVGLRGKSVINSRDTYERLVALGATPDPDDVDGVIGNTSWTTSPRCDGCGRIGTGPRVMVGAESDYESPTACLCVDCVKAALATFENECPSADERIQQLESALAASKRHAALWKRFAKGFHSWYVRRPVASKAELNADMQLISAGPAEKGFEFRLAGRRLVRMVGSAFIDLLNEAGAPNCVEMAMVAENGDGVFVEVRRHGGKTMAQLRDEAIARAEWAERELAELKAGRTP